MIGTTQILNFLLSRLRYKHRRSLSRPVCYAGSDDVVETESLHALPPTIGPSVNTPEMLSWKRRTSKGLIHQSDVWRVRGMYKRIPDVLGYAFISERFQGIYSEMLCLYRGDNSHRCWWIKQRHLSKQTHRYCHCIACMPQTVAWDNNLIVKPILLHYWLFYRKVLD